MERVGLGPAFGVYGSEASTCRMMAQEVMQMWKALGMLQPLVFRAQRPAPAG